MCRVLKRVVPWFILAVAFPLAAIGQTHYKCRNASGSTIFSDMPCPSGSRQEKAEYAAPQAQQQYPSSQNSNARMLDAKVAEALGTGNFSLAKALAVTPEHWQMISNAENSLRQPITGRTDADLRAESKNSQECKEAQRSYDVDASSIRNDGAQINASKRKMYSACGMNEPTVVENRTVINDNRRVVAPAPRPTNCRQLAGGRIECW